MNSTTKRSCYRWHEEFSRYQVSRLHSVRVAARQVDPTTAKASRFCLRQIGYLDAMGEYLWAPWQAKPDQWINLSVLSLADLYTETLYSQALRALAERMPDYASVAFEDGDRTGERRIVFTQENSEQASAWLVGHMYALAELPNFGVRPTVRVRKELCKEFNREEWHIQLFLNEPEITRPLVQQAVENLQAGRPLDPDDRTERRFPWQELRGRLVSLTHPELVYLNWKEARKPAGSLEERLWYAINVPDAQEIKRALEAGADPNLLNERGSSPLCALIEDYGNLWINAIDQEEGKDISHYPSIDQLLELTDCFVAHGAEVNLAGPEQRSAVLEAACNADVRLLERLLEFGGKVDERDTTEEIGAFPIWDGAYRRCDGSDDMHHDTSVLDLLTTRYGNPYDGTN